MRPRGSILNQDDRHLFASFSVDHSSLLESRGRGTSIDRQGKATSRAPAPMHDLTQRSRHAKVGLCSVTAPSRSDACGAPVKRVGVHSRDTEARLEWSIRSTLAGKMGTQRSAVPTGVGAPAPSDAGHCITHPSTPSASDSEMPEASQQVAVGGAQRHHR